MVPRLIQKGMKWQLYGLSAARQLQIVRGECSSRFQSAMVLQSLRRAHTLHPVLPQRPESEKPFSCCRLACPHWMKQVNHSIWHSASTDTCACMHFHLTAIAWPGVIPLLHQQICVRACILTKLPLPGQV